MNTRIPIFLLLLAVIAAMSGAARAAQPGQDSSALRLHIKAERLYDDGHFERAYFIYVNELAMAGDKYGQYMAGYMCLNGLGVEQDYVEASAWYRLAAERELPEFVEVRDQLLESMSEAERVRSDTRFVELRSKYSDMALALERVREARQELYAGSTGTRILGGGSRPTGPVTIVDPDTGATMSLDAYVSGIENRMQVRLDYITRHMGVARVDAGMTNREFAAFADQVRDYFSVIDDR